MVEDYIEEWLEEWVMMGRERIPVAMADTIRFCAGEKIFR